MPEEAWAPTVNEVSTGELQSNQLLYPFLRGLIAGDANPSTRKNVP